MPNTTVPAAATGLPETTPDPLTRRSILAGLAGATLAAAAPAAAATYPDAELLAAGREFDRRISAWSDVWLRSQDAEYAVVETCVARGFPQWSSGAIDILNRGQEYLAIRREVRADAAAGEADAVAGAIDEAAKAVRALPPTTIAGLAVHARVARWDFSPAACAGFPPEDDYGPEQVAAFLDLVERIAAGRVA